MPIPTLPEDIIKSLWGIKEDEQEHPSGLFLVEDRSETSYSAAAVLLITAADLDLHIEHSDDQDKAVSDLVEVDQSILIHKTCFR